MAIMEEEIDLREYIKVLIERKGLILTIFLVSVIITGIISYLVLTPIYKSSITFEVAKINETPIFNAKDIENRIKSDFILQEVISECKLDLKPSELSDFIKIDKIESNGYVTLSIEYTFPEKAKDIVESVVNHFIEVNQPYYQRKITLLKEEKKSIEEQMALEKEKIDEVERLRLDIIKSNEFSLTEKQIQNNLLVNYSTQIRENYNNLVNTYYKLENQILNSKDFEIINYPIVPQTPIKPNKKLNLAISGVLGLFLGIFIAFFMEFWEGNR